MTELQERYKKEIVPALVKKFEYKSVMEAPKLEKIVINMGVNDVRENSKALENAIARYTDNIQELFNSGLPVYQPEAMDYDLMDYVHKMRKDWC